MIRKPEWLTIFFILILSTGCGYHLVRQSSFGAEGVRKVFVETMRNQTKEPGLDTIVTDALIKEFWHWNGVDIVNRPEAEAILSGAVTEYTADNPISFDQDRNVREYELIIHLDVQLKEASTNKIFWRKKDLIMRESYRFFETDLAMTRAEEKRAQMKAARDLARELLGMSFTGF